MAAAIVIDVRRLHAEKLGRDVMARAAATASPMNDAGEDEHQRFTGDEAEHFFPLRAHRHANTDLASAARDVVRHQPEQADGRDEDRDGSEEHIGLCQDFLLRETPFHLGHLRFHGHNRNIRVDVA